MRIQSNNPLSLSKIADVTPVKGSRAQGATQAGATPDASETGVVVSPQAQSLTQATQQSHAAHRAHVENLKAQVQAGTYTVDKQKLADRIVDDELTRQASS